VGLAHSKTGIEELEQRISAFLSGGSDEVEQQDESIDKEV
jgi:hypothetical protein